MGRASPEWQSAKPLLEEDYHNVDGIQDMTIDQVIALRPDVYGKVKRTNFGNNWKKMKERMNAASENPTQQQVRKQSGGPTAWEIARPLLEQDYLSGLATADMVVDEVIALKRTIYGKVPRANFANNWRALKLRVDQNIERAKQDLNRYEHDSALYCWAEDLPWEWHGSEAELLLKIDVEKKRHLRYHPSYLYMKRTAYQEFDYDIFRKHVHQEARAALESPYWMIQKKKKEKKKQLIEEAIEEALQGEAQFELENAFGNLTI